MSDSRETLRKQAIEKVLAVFWDDEIKHFKKWILEESEGEKMSFIEFKNAAKAHTLYDLICIKDCHVNNCLMEIWQYIFDEPRSESDSD
jgi:hypothetical protein